MKQLIGLVGLSWSLPTLVIALTSINPPLDHHLETFISDTTIVNIPEKNLKADISFLFIDFKYDSSTNKVKICEFGRGKTTGLGNTPVTMSINDMPTTMFSPYWPSFWYYLANAIDMPVWYVGIKPADHLSEQLNRTESNDAWNSFIGMGGIYHETLRNLERDPLFQKVKFAGSYKYHDLKSHKGLIIYKPTASDCISLSAFKKKYPQFLYLDDIGSIYGGYKHIGALLFEDSTLKEYKPCFKTYRKEYVPHLAQTIINDIKSDIFVIKPVSAGYGRGIIMVTKADLDITLQHICNYKQLPIPPTAYEEQSKTYSHWKYNKDNVFIVEEYCPSTPLFVHGKVYDPTVRIHFILRHDSGKMYINMLGGYHKIPVKALSDEGSLTEKHKTVPYYKSDVALSALTIPSDEFTRITTALKSVLPKIYHKMLKNRGPQS